MVHMHPYHEARHNFPVLEHWINAGKWYKAQHSTNLPPLQTFVEVPLGSRGLQGMVSWLCASLLSCSPEHFQCFHLLLSKISIAVLSTHLFKVSTLLLVVHHLLVHLSPFFPRTCTNLCGCTGTETSSLPEPQWHRFTHQYQFLHCWCQFASC